jgi:hypothetical protein
MCCGASSDGYFDARLQRVLIRDTGAWFFEAANGSQGASDFVSKTIDYGDRFGEVHRADVAADTFASGRFAVALRACRL